MDIKFDQVHLIMSMMRSWSTVIIFLINNAKFSSSLTPALLTSCDRVSMTRRTQLFQSSLASQEDFFAKGHSCPRNRNEPGCLPFKNHIDNARKQNLHYNIYSPRSDSTKPTTKLDTSDSYFMVHVEEQLTHLRSKNLNELKLACSRRNIRYGMFSEKEEYINAILRDMEKTFDFSVTGLVQPGAVTELTEKQLDLEVSSKKSLIVVAVFAKWCGPCSVVIPQLEMAARKLIEDEVRVVKINGDKYPSYAARYQVAGLPSILLIKEGHVLDRMEGVSTTTEISNFIQQHLSCAKRKVIL